MKTRSLKACSLISISRLLPLSIFLTMTAPIKAADLALQIDSRIRSSLVEHHDTNSELAGLQNSLDLEVLTLNGSWSRPGYAGHIVLDLASDFEIETCKHHVLNDIKQQRCRYDRFKIFNVSRPLSNDITLTMGKLLVPQDGWNNYEPSATNLLPTMNFDKPFDWSQPAVGLNLHELSLIVTNDVSTAFPSVGEFTNIRTQPTVILEWKESKCKICFLTQVGNYDLNHSQFLNIGAKFLTERTTGFIDIGLDARDRKYMYERHRSERWHSILQVESKWDDEFSLYIKTEAFRMFKRGLPGSIQFANKPGEIDQNLWQGVIGYIWAPTSSQLRYFVDARASLGKFYDTYPDGPETLKRQSAIGLGVIAVMTSHI